MSVGAGDRSVYTFGPYSFDGAGRSLLRDGVVIRLPPKAGDLLLALLEADGRLVSKQELLNHLWPDTFVEEGNLTFQVYEVRRALQDGGEGRRYIETVPRRGYRFMAPITKSAAASPSSVGGEPQAPPSLSPPPRDNSPVDFRSRRSTFVTWTAITLTTTTVIAGAAVIAFSRATADVVPHVLRYARLTFDGQTKLGLIALGKSQLLVYFRDRSRVLDLATNAVIAPTFPDFAVFDVSRTRNEALGVRPRDSGAETGLWVIPLDRTAPRRIPGVDADAAAWSPDGRLIAYSWMHSLYVMAPDGPLVQPLAAFAGEPRHLRWSPDGRFIRFELVIHSDRTVTFAIWEIRPDGSGAREVVPPSSEDHGGLTCCGDWLSDGTTFVFESARAGAPAIWALRDIPTLLRSVSPRIERLTGTSMEFSSPVTSRDGNRLYAIGRVPGTHAVAYDLNTRSFKQVIGGLPAYWVDYSPDGQRVVYVSEPDRRLWIANVDGSSARSLPIAPVERVDGCAWSPDGKWIAFRGAEPSRHHKIYLIAPDTTSRPLPINAGDVEQGIPSWSPDSRRLTFGDVPERFGAATGTERIHLYDLSAGTERTVPNSDGLWTSRWSPDGRYLAALTIRGQELRLFDWSHDRWHDTIAAHVDNPTWSRDGRYIYFGPEGDAAPVVSRLRVSDGTVEPLVSVTGVATRWSGVAPDNSPILLSIGESDVYALDLAY